MAHKIRHALTTDHDVIAEINTLAFGKPDEAGLIARLRADGDTLLEMVADDARGVDGHILFSRLWAGNGRLYAALAPMSVRPGLQKDGLGSALVRAGLDYLPELGVQGVLVLGHPRYYPRFGFSPETAASVRSPYSGSPAFMALALEADAFDEAFSLAYPSAFSA